VPASYDCHMMTGSSGDGADSCLSDISSNDDVSDVKAVSK